MDFRNVWRTVVPAFVRQQFAAKLLVALLAVVVLTVGFGALVQVQTNEALRADATDELTTTAEVRGETLDAWLASVRQQSRLTARHPAVQSGESDRVRSHLRELVDSGTVPESVIAVHYYDTDAKRILVSSDERLEGVSPAEQGAPFARDPPTFDGPADTYVSDPFEVPVVDHPVLTVMSPVAGADDRAVIYMIDLRQRVAGLTNVADGQIVVVNDAGEFVAHPEPSRIGETWQGETEMSLGADGTSFTERDDTLNAATTIQAADWTVVVSVPTATAYALGDRVSSAIVGLILLMMATLGVVGAVIGSDTVSSLERISRRAGQMADGDLDVSLSTRRDDEFADLVGTFTEMRDSVRESLTAAEQARADAETARSEAQAQADRLAETASSYEAVMRAVADGDLTRRVDTDVESEAMQAVGETFNETVAEIEQTVTEVKQFSEHVARAAATANDDVAAVTETNESVLDSVGEIADGASQQAGELSRVQTEMSQLSANAEEVAATVKDVADTSRQAAEAGATGRDRAERALAEMDEIRTQTAETATQIETLDDQVAEIGEIAEVIAEIADQTNLLALNASIEAARAGSGASGTSGTGKSGAGDANAADGFAVVADEVKGLAEETKESAEEVETRIEAIQRRTAETVDVVHETGDRVESGSETVTEAIDSLEEIVTHVEGIDGDIQEIASATGQQAQSSEAVVETVETVAAISEQTSAEAETVDTATERQAETLTDVSEAAAGLATRADRLRELLSAFTVTESDRQTPQVDVVGATEVTTDD